MSHKIISISVSEEDFSYLKQDNYLKPSHIFRIALKNIRENRRDDIDRIKQIHKRLPNTHLVMHGSSSVPQEWLKVINENGGEIPETYGVPLEEIQEGIRHGVRKINIDTDLRLASTGSIRRYLANNPSEFDPRKYFSESLKAMKEIVVSRYEAFGTTGNASRIKPISLDAMSQRYLSGALDPI